MPAMVINDLFHDFTTSELKLIVGDTTAEVYAEIHDVSYSDGRDPQNVPGAGGISLGSTRGMYKADEGSMIMYLARAREYLAKLKAYADPKGIGVCDIVQRLQVSYRLPGESTIITDVITFRLKNAGDGGKASDSGAIVTTFKLFVSQVERNGVIL